MVKVFSDSNEAKKGIAEFKKMWPGDFNKFETVKCDGGYIVTASLKSNNRRYAYCDDGGFQ